MTVEELLADIFESVIQRYVSIILAGQLFSLLLVIGVAFFVVAAVSFWLGMKLSE